MQTPNKDRSIPLVCARSGLTLGNFEGASAMTLGLGFSPYIKVWKENTFLHPVFSLSLRELVLKSLACWESEKSGTRSYSPQYKGLLFLAMLHASDCIKQDVPAFPSLKTIDTHFNRLIELLSWKQDINSTRLVLPKLHIWKGAKGEDTNNPFAGVGAWLDACDSAKNDYENTVRTRQKEAKQKASVLAERSIRSQMYSNISLRRPWDWIETQVPQFVMEANADLELLFFAAEERIQHWDEADIDALEGLVLSHCELGNNVSYEVNKRIKQLRTWHSIYMDTFEIVVDREKMLEEIGSEEPVLANFPSRSAWLVAHAKWKLATAAPAPAKSTRKPSLKITAEDL